MQRAVVNLRLVDEVPGEDVARQLGTTKSHVAVLLFRARQRLQRCLESGDSPSLAHARSQPALQVEGPR